MEIKDYLLQLDNDNLWEKIESETINEFVKLPDGRYIATLQEPTISISKKSGRLQILWPLTIEEGKYSKQKVYKIDGLETESNIAWSKALFNLLGIKIPKKAKKLPEILKQWYEEEYNNRKLNISIKTKDDIMNTYINSFVESFEEEEEEEKEEEPKEKKESKNRKKLINMTEEQLKEYIIDNDLENIIDINTFDLDDKDDKLELVKLIIKSL